MLIMLDKRQKVIMPAIRVQQEVFRSMKVESGSKTPYTDATQVRKYLFSIEKSEKLEKCREKGRKCYYRVYAVRSADRT